MTIIITIWRTGITKVELTPRNKGRNEKIQVLIES